MSDEEDDIILAELDDENSFNRWVMTSTMASKRKSKKA